MSIWVSILLITFTSTSWGVAVIMQKKAADKLPLITMGKGSFKTIWAFIRSPLWMGGLVLTGIGWGVFVFALNFTPISLARAITATGYVLLAVLSRPLLGPAPEPTSLAVIDRRLVHRQAGEHYRPGVDELWRAACHRHAGKHLLGGDEVDVLAVGR